MSETKTAQQTSANSNTEPTAEPIVLFGAWINEVTEDGEGEPVLMGIFSTKEKAVAAIEFYCEDALETTGEWNEYEEYHTDQGSWCTAEVYHLDMIDIL